MACHMPRFPTADIAHTAVTDHRILRRLEEGDPALAQRRLPRPGEIPIVEFSGKERAPDDPDRDRDLGVALTYLTRRPSPLRKHCAPLAFPLVQKAVEAAPDDVVAQEALAWGLTLQGRSEEALAAYAATLARAPERETTLNLAAALAEGRGRWEDAAAYLRRVLRVNPWSWDYHYSLARVLAQKQDWPAALEACEKALQLAPVSEEPRKLFITCCLHAGKRDRAEGELRKLLTLNPSEERALRTWFAEQAR
jgi:tetratricopeptide (TPR) repeat protein